VLRLSAEWSINGEFIRMNLGCVGIGIELQISHVSCYLSKVVILEKHFNYTSN
jgi:hypothetical protein